MAGAARMSLGSIVTVSIVVTGCVTDAAPTPSATVTDSAGIRIVQHDLRVTDVAEWRTLAAFDLEHHLRHVDFIFDRVFS